MEAYISQAALNAFRQLVVINREAGTPEMQAWMHSDIARPVLTEILLSVPCSATVH